MLTVGSKVKAADNAGGILFKCTRVFGGFKRQYAGLGETIGVVSYSRKSYRRETDKLRLAKLINKVKKKRKIKNKKKKQPNLRPYLGLLVALKKSTKRINGLYLKFDENRMFTFTEPTKQGAAGKTNRIPNFIGTRTLGPACIELVKDKKTRIKFKSVIFMTGGIV
jgi:ribosomal protein L14